MRASSITVLAVLAVLGCEGLPSPAEPASQSAASRRPGPAQLRTVGSIERYDPRADAILPQGAVVERLTDDVFGWSEGPVWMAERAQLLFTDVPGNTLYGWSEARGLEVVLRPSGYSGDDADGFREAGANGLIKNGPNTLLMGDHGNRAVMRLDLTTMEKTVVIDRYDGARFSSPNDLVAASDGSLYFTDPPYGLEGGDDSPMKETAFNGVYRMTPDGTLKVIDDTLARPNGVALSPDEQTLYVAQSSPEAATVYAYELDAGERRLERRVFADLTNMVQAGEEGLPDGMAVTHSGEIFVAGPGGVHLFSASGERLALIRTGTRAANVTLTDQEDAAYITSAAFLARVRLTAPED